MARSRETIFHKNWTGGLRVSPNMRDVREDQVAEVLNMDFGYEGGFILRGGFQSQLVDTNFVDARFLCPTYFGSDFLLVVGNDGSLFEWDGSILADTTEDLSDVSVETAPLRAVATRSRSGNDGFALIVNGRGSGAILSQKWDGMNLTTLSQNFNDDYNSLNEDSVPASRLIASHSGHIWVADTVEDGVRFPHRLRFSHLYAPTDWATDDFFDVGERVDDSGDPITALVSFGSSLLVFKRTGVWAVYGYSRDDFFYEQITTVSGVSTPDQVTTSPGRCYWYADNGEALYYDGSKVDQVTDAFRWWSESGAIRAGGRHVTMWGHGRLWFSLEASVSAGEGRFLLVYDPAINALTQYSPNVLDMVNWPKLNADDDTLFLFDDSPNIMRFDHRYAMDVEGPTVLNDVSYGALTDVSGSSLLPVDSTVPNVVPITGSLRTGWFTAGETATKKRWKRPRVTGGANTSATIRVGVYHDYDSINEIKRNDMRITTDESTSLWSVMEWDTDDWASAEVEYGFSRLPSAGGAHAIQLKFDCIDNVGKWWIDSIALPFRRKQVR